MAWPVINQKRNLEAGIWSGIERSSRVRRPPRVHPIMNIFLQGERELTHDLTFVYPKAMLPVFLLSTTVFLALSLIRTHLSHSKSLSESSERIAELENQLAKVRRDRRIQLAKERKERERILPMVVERVLQRVGAMRQGDEEAIEEEHLKEGERLLV